MNLTPTSVLTRQGTSRGDLQSSENVEPWVVLATDLGSSNLGSLVGNEPFSHLTKHLDTGLEYLHTSEMLLRRHGAH
jgi:hypothetical protein